MCHTPRGGILCGIMILKGLHSIATDSTPPPHQLPTHTFICFLGCLQFQLLSTVVLSSWKHLQTRMPQCSRGYNDSFSHSSQTWLKRTFAFHMRIFHLLLLFGRTLICSIQQCRPGSSLSCAVVLSILRSWLHPDWVCICVIDRARERTHGKCCGFT